MNLMKLFTGIFSFLMIIGVFVLLIGCIDGGKVVECPYYFPYNSTVYFSEVRTGASFYKIKYDGECFLIYKSVNQYGLTKINCPDSLVVE